MYRRYRRIIAGVLTGCICLLAGCTAEDTEMKAETEKAVGNISEEPLVFATWSDEETYARKVVDAYNALKGREEIQLQVIRNQDHEVWMQEYSDEYGVDIIGLRGNSHLLMLQRKGKLTGLREYIQKSDLDITAYGNMFNEIVYEDEYYGLPARSTCWALYYNKELFDRMGIAYPEQMTWSEYLELAGRISSENPDVWGGYFPPWIYHLMAVQQGYYLLDDDLETVSESLEFLQELYEDGSHLPFDEVKDAGDECRYVFEEGNTAMMINGEWLANMFLEDAAADREVPEWDIAPLPVPENVDAGTSIGMYQFAGITSVCSDPDRAYEFLEFLCGEEGALIYARNAIIPGYSNEAIKRAYMEAAGTEQASIFFEAKKIQEQPMWYDYDLLIDAFEDKARKFLEKKYTLDEAMCLFLEERADIFG